MIQIPFPGLPKSDGGLLGSIVRIVWDVITQKPSGEIVKTKQQNKNSSVENVDKIQSILEDYRGQVHREANKIEGAIHDEVAHYVEELNGILLQERELLDKYKIKTKQIERVIERFLRNINGNIDKMLCKKVSLDNPECRNILQMIPGTKKEQVMSDFLNKSLKEVLNQYCTDFRQNLSDLFENVEEEIVQAVGRTGEEAERQYKILENIDEDNYIEKNEAIVTKAASIIALCDLIGNQVEV